MLLERSKSFLSHPLVEVRGVLLVPDVRNRVVVFHGRSSAISGMVVPLVDEGPGEKGEENQGPRDNVADSSLKVLGVRNVRNRVLDKGVDVGLDIVCRHLGGLELERDLGDGRLGVSQSGRGSEQSGRSHGHHSRGLKSSDGSRLHCRGWFLLWLLLFVCSKAVLADGELETLRGGLPLYIHFLVSRTRALISFVVSPHFITPP